MSGFFGLLRTGGEAVERVLLERVASGLQFRGPDGTSIETGEGFAACFARMDVFTGHQAPKQPVWLADRYALIGDVRLDAREELAEALLRRGEFAANAASDEEFVLRAWAAWGASALEKLLGDYSFALWDRAEQVLWCARDFTGARPFFYAAFTGGIAFSNTLRVLREVPEISNELDEIFLGDFLLEGLCNDRERTIWHCIRRLKPGHLLRFSREGLRTQRFLNLPIEDPLQLRDTSEYLEMFRGLLQRAIRSRLPAGKTSFYLSGGLDSALVCAMAVNTAVPKDTTERFRAFTISWRPLVADEEAEYAKVTAEFLRLPQEILEDAGIVPFAGDALENSPEPTGEIFQDRDLRIFARVAAHSRVVLAGDGGDDVLTGQSWPYFRFLWQRGQWSTLAKSFGGYVGTHGKLPPLGAGILSTMRRWLRPGASTDELPEWLNRDFAERVLANRERVKVESGSEKLEKHPLHPEAYKALHSGYWGMVLESEDAGITGVLLETRAPLLDLRVVKFLLRLTPVPWCMEKELARKAMKGLVPDNVLARRKSPLPTDPLTESQVRYGWQPELPKFPAKSLQSYVQWDSWLATLHRSKGSLGWENLYPLSLCKWLKAIETEREDSVK